MTTPTHLIRAWRDRLRDLCDEMDRLDTIHEAVPYELRADGAMYEIHSALFGAKSLIDAVVGDLTTDIEEREE